MTLSCVVLKAMSARCPWQHNRSIGILKVGRTLTNRIYIYCPVVTEKSTNPSVKLTLTMPRHGQVNLTRGLVDFSVTNGQ